MGATGSSSSAAIAVQLDQSGPVHGGGHLSGKVYLSIPKDAYTADTLNLKFFGQESTCVHYQESESYTDSDGNSQTRSVTRSAYDSCPIVVMDISLASFPNGRVERGRYEFPFVLTLPFGLPGKQGTKSNGSYYVIEYFVEARLHRPGWLKWDVVNHQEVFLMDPPQASVQTPSFNAPVTTPVFFCCCFNQGNMSLLSNVNDTNIGVGEPLKIDYSIYNQSSASIKAIEIKLDQSMSWYARGHSEHSSTTLYKNRIEAASLDGIDRVSKDNQKPLLRGEGLFEEMNRHLSHVQFTVPACRSTVAGKLGTVRHIVTVRIITKMCVDNPQLNLDLTIYRPSANAFQGVAPAVGTVFARPADWQASAAPVVSLQPTLAMATAVSAAPPMATVISVDSNPVAAAPSAPLSAPAATDYSSVAALVQMLQTQGSAMTEVSLLKEWLTYGDVSQLAAYPATFSNIFGTIRSEYALSAFPENLGKALPGQVTLAHVVEAARATKTPEARGKVCSAFSSFVQDKTNAKVAFDSLGLPSHILTLVLQQYI